MEIRRIRDTADPEVIALVAKSDEYLDSLYPPESNHAEPLDALVGGDSAFFAGYIGDELVACGAVKVQSADLRYGEIKRVYVAEEHRGKRLATAIVRHLEAFVLDRGISVVRLEAGPMQPEALGLYSRLGYHYRGPFGKYAPDPLSVFMEKTLDT